jgi:hypothetical protein
MYWVLPKVDDVWRVGIATFGGAGGFAAATSFSAGKYMGQAIAQTPIRMTAQKAKNPVFNVLNGSSGVVVSTSLTLACRLTSQRMIRTAAPLVKNTVHGGGSIKYPITILIPEYLCREYSKNRTVPANQ